MTDKEFDKYEKRGAYHWEWYLTNKHTYRDNVSFVLEHLPETGSVLDIGGGDGLISYKLFEKGLDVLCVDYSAVGIALAHKEFERAIYGTSVFKYPRKWLSQLGIQQSRLMSRYAADKLKVWAGSIFDMAVDKPFDYIVCHEVIEHMPDPAALVKLIHNAIRYYALISTPDVTNQPPHALDYHSWTPQSFKEFLKDYRFEFIKCDGKHMYVKLYK
jgi:2-polyprenyl-3-methyl-5-hydroxy-6-metoxy-1,4-benzoquinol methylase